MSEEIPEAEAADYVGDPTNPPVMPQLDADGKPIDLKRLQQELFPGKDEESMNRYAKALQQRSGPNTQKPAGFGGGGT